MLRRSQARPQRSTFHFVGQSAQQAFCMPADLRRGRVAGPQVAARRGLAAAAFAGVSFFPLSRDERKSQIRSSTIFAPFSLAFAMSSPFLFRA